MFVVPEDLDKLGASDWAAFISYVFANDVT